VTLTAPRRVSKLAPTGSSASGSNVSQSPPGAFTRTLPSGSTMTVFPKSGAGSGFGAGSGSGSRIAGSSTVSGSVLKTLSGP
jgi:hypothetical protein